MKLFSYQIPEVAHLPPSEREAILRHCAQSPRLAGYRKIAPKIVGGVLALAGIVFAFLGYRMFILLPAFTGVFLLLLIAKLGGEILFLRFEAKKMIACGFSAVMETQPNIESTKAVQSTRANPLVKVLIGFAIGLASLLALMGILYLTDPRK